jgi:hypothetical protein
LRIPDTSTPLLDSEIGYHPNHPRVQAGEVDSSRGWDGDFGPFLTDNDEQLDCSDKDRADLTRRAFDGEVGFSGLDQVTTEELIRRMQELRVLLRRLVKTNKDP